METLTFAFALVAIVALCAAAASLTLAVRLNSRFGTSWRTLRKALDDLSSEHQRSMPAKVRAEVEDLAAALDSHRRSTRSELGRLWQRMGRDAPPAPNSGVDAALADLDPELAAELAFQRQQAG